MTKFINAYTETAHIAGYVHVELSGEMECSDVDFPVDMSYAEACEILMDQMERELELMVAGGL
jgi:hypothetical protein